METARLLDPRKELALLLPSIITCRLRQGKKSWQDTATTPDQENAYVGMLWGS